MDISKRMKIEIGGKSYIITTTEDEDYVNILAKEINKNVTGLMDKNDTISLNDALVLTTLGYADAYKKSEVNADHIRTQLTEYLEDAARARVEADEARREASALKRAILQKEAENAK